MNIYSVSIYAIGGPINPIALPSMMHQEFLNIGNICCSRKPKHLQKKVFPSPKNTSLNQWLVHRPFIPMVSSHQCDPAAASFPHQLYTEHSNPFGTPIPTIDPTQILRVVVQNTQHDFKLLYDGISLPIIIENLKSIGANMFFPISPNVYWKNPSNYIRTKQIFHPHFPHIHITAVSSDIGNDPLYRKSSLIGRSAIGIKTFPLFWRILLSTRGLI
jgi:hypothetical protein